MSTPTVTTSPSTTAKSTDNKCRTTRRNVFLASDKSLLSSGEFADVTEAESGSIELDDNPKMFKYIVEYLYSGDTLLADVAEDLRACFSLETRADKLPADFWQKFIDGVEIAFRNEAIALEPLRQAFVQSIADNQYLISQDNSFCQAMSEVPKFATAVFQKVSAPMEEMPTNIAGTAESLPLYQGMRMDGGMVLGAIDDPNYEVIQKEREGLLDVGSKAGEDYSLRWEFGWVEDCY
ncbi:hypothetical protein MKZ38_006602 [Zalerion maritima]|uniref:BTB domain-containing protein n=1 Tax=Zalerion maritima TaxID=339359 RepID=A0AAD5RJE8_9PEZI|nr:hypothetical protein MKZ38_006602 [Zalerion maritima]